MPARYLISKELAKIFSVFSHPDRVRIVEELRDGERDVNTLQAMLGVSHSRTSQNLAILRMHRIVTERRDGRYVYYRLLQPELAAWIFEGIRFIEKDAANAEVTRDAIEKVKQLWGAEAVR
ncbi:MAG: helix-turn-helix transcriptional regulator [Acidobacteria bacterium]|nr:helix-turn-helix transcriptional regulator [Acidobacteriota bacterium]